jgi:hypothetical protein
MMNWIAEMTKEALSKSSIRGEVITVGNRLVIKIPAEEIKKAVLNSFDEKLRPYVEVQASDITISIALSM